MADNLVVFGHTYNGVAGFKATDTNNVEQTFTKTVLGTKNITANGTYNASDDSLDGFSQVEVNVSGGGIDFDDYIKNPPTFPSGDYVFNGTSIRDYAFAYLASQNGSWPEWTIHAPNCTYLGQNAFRECRTLKEAHFPSLTSFHATNYIFYMPTSGTRKLALIDWGFCNITSNMFKYAANLTTLILRKTTIATLNNVSAFDGTPFRNGGSGGTIYIPKALYDHLGDGTSSDYKAASNWSTVDGYGTITWAKIEGSIYEL